MIELKVPAKAVRGGQISGSYKITGEESRLLKNAKGVHVDLTCAIADPKYLPQGKDEELDVVMAEMQELYQDSRIFEKDASGAFDFDLPEDLPATYMGKLIAVNWIVNVKIDSPMKTENYKACKIVVE